MKTLSNSRQFSSTSLNIAWHPAFVEALQMELYAYRDALEFHSEFQLTSEPLRIDCVVIKKEKDIVIEKNFAAIFKECNLLEYKNPDDYVSVDDFYKVYGYACLYASFERIPITSLTISFVVSRYPQKLLGHLRKKRRYTVAETYSGIYTVNGDILPIQIIDSRRLSADENLWLKSLSDKLDFSEVEQISTEIARQDKAARITAYRDVIVRANAGTIQEVLMKKARLTIEEVVENVGLTAKWEARGRAEGEKHKALTIAQNLVNLGLPLETVVSATQLDIEKVKSLYLSSG
jgi:hypothetical protein